MEFNEFEAEDAADERGRALGNSHPLDVHCWSEHPEANLFVNQLYEQIFAAGGKAEIKKKHLKVLLLDLYVTWRSDPTAKIGIARSNNAYKQGARYNELHITRTVVEVVDVLREAGLLEQVDGFFDRRRNGRGRTSRIWPSEVLLRLFREARFSHFDVGYHPHRATVILRDKDPDTAKAREVPYETTDETERMSAMLARYNALLRRTFIDIPSLRDGIIPVEGERKAHRLAVTQHDKFVRRIFGRSSFNCGGRFYGGWWQRAPKEWRTRIFFDDWPANEVDFRGFHIMLLYAQQGVGYWNEREDDPYSIAVPAFLASEAQARDAAKLLTLMALNSGRDREAFDAFRDKQPAGSVEKRLTNDQLSELLAAIVEKHPRLRNDFFADRGISLMNLDAKVTEIILSRFEERDIPVLPVHDSYIVPTGYEEALKDLMHQAFAQVTGVELGGRVDNAHKEEAESVEELWNRLMAWSPYNTLDEEARAYRERSNPERTDRYRRELSEFRVWLDNAGPD